MHLRSGLSEKRFSSLQIQGSTNEDNKNNDNDRELRDQVGMHEKRTGKFTYSRMQGNSQSQVTRQIYERL